MASTLQSILESGKTPVLNLTSSLSEGQKLLLFIAICSYEIGRREQKPLVAAVDLAGCGQDGHSLPQMGRPISR